MNNTFIIAEAGVNHNGSLEIAFELVNAAKAAGADAIKFQSFNASSLIIQNEKKVNYQKKDSNDSESQYTMLKRLELSEQMHVRIFHHCKNAGIRFLSSPFDLESILLLRNLGLETFKIPSGEINNLPYLRSLGRLQKEIIMSTGMSDLEEIKYALNVLLENGTNKKDITVLHCNTQYPTPHQDVNLNAMITIRDTFNVKVGYSDHTKGIEIPIAAVAMGARVIEKHFTLNNQMEGPDHLASLQPDEFKAMVNGIRIVELAMGNGKKIPSPSELQNRNLVRKSIVASIPVKKGEVFSDLNLGVKRPANGLDPKLWDSVIGRIANRDFSKDELIEF